MDAETRTIVRAGLDASAYTAGAAQVAAANERIATSGEAVARTQEAAEGTARRTATAIDRLQASLDQTYRAQQQFERAQTQINSAVERGSISAQRAAELQELARQKYLGTAAAADEAAAAQARLAAASERAADVQRRIAQITGLAGNDNSRNRAADIEAYGRSLDELRAKYVPLFAAQQRYQQQLDEIARAERIGAISAAEAAAARARLGQVSAAGAGATNAFAAANDNASRSTSRFGQVMGQAGFQVQDFASQVMAGGNAMVAFGQQGSQLLGIFGTGGAIAGAVLTVGILAYQLLAARDASEDLARSQDGLGRAMEKSIEFFETAAERVARLAREARASIVVSMIPDMMRLEREIEARERALELLGRDREERIRANRNLPGFNADTVLREPIERARRELGELREQLRGLEQERERVLTAPSGADRDATERSLERIREEQRREGERAARDAERQRQAEEREQDRARQAREREEERARDRREREEEQARRREEAAAKQSTDDIVRYGADAFADMFDANSRGWRGMLDTFEATFRRTLARMAAEAIIRPIIQPIVAGLMGTPGGDGTMAGGLTGLLGLSGLGSGISGALGLGGAGAGLSGLLNTTVIGASGPIGPTVSGAAMGGGASLGQLVGGAGLGFGAGALLNGLVGGNRTNGMLGSGGGAAAGAVIGSLLPGVGTVIGGLIGGAGGGLLGGMIGPRGGPGFFHLGVAANDNGLLSITDSGQKRAGDQLAALQQQTAQQIDALNRQMAALGVRVSGRAVLGSDRADPGRAGDLGAAAGQFRLTAMDARIQGVIDRAGQGLNALGAAQQASDLIGALGQITRAAEDAANPITAITRQFDSLRDAANRLGFGFDEVQAAQRRAIGAAIAPSISGLADYARGLRTANDNAGNPMSRLAAAESQFSATISAALSGDLSALGRVQSSAETFRGLSRDVFGTGQGFAAAEARIVAALDQIGGISGDQLTASVLAAETRNQTDTLVAALARLQDEVAALRREARQQGANPLAARAA